MARTRKSTKRLKALTKPVKFPTAMCGFCRKHKNVMPSGLFEIHTIKGKWSTSLCRGSGEKPTSPTSLPSED